MNIIRCNLTNSGWYKETNRDSVPVGVLWHDTSAGNPNVKRYVQPSKDDRSYNELMSILGTNKYENSWNREECSSGCVNAVIGKLANGTIGTVECAEPTFQPYGCGKSTYGSCNGYYILNGEKHWTNEHWVQFEICDDGYEDEEYFNQVYKEACEYTAYICHKYNINPFGCHYIGTAYVPNITCHSEAHTIGVASDHNDPMVWFKKFNKTMDDVRTDVKKILDEMNKESENEQYTSEPTDHSIEPEVKKDRKKILKNILKAIEKFVQWLLSFCE